MMSFLRRYLLGNASRLNIRPPEPLAQRDGIAIVAIVKNEEEHIAEWLRFHTIAGAKAFFLYDNGSTDKTIQVAKKAVGVDLTVIPWIIDIRLSNSDIKLWRQPLAYAHAVCNFGQLFEWMTFLDVDEYLVPLLDITIPEALARLPRHPNISLPWTMFGFGGNGIKPDSPIPFAYEQRAAKRTKSLLNFKCIVDPCEVTRVQVHKFETISKGAETMNDAGRCVSSYKERSKEHFPSSNILQLNHYYTYSREELEEKIRKGGVSLTEYRKREVQIRRLANEIEENTEIDKAARNFLLRNGVSESNFFSKSAREG